MNEYRGKHAPSHPWPVASTAHVRVRRGRHRKKNRRRAFWTVFAAVVILAVIAYPFIEARILTTDKAVIRAEDLPSDANRLRVVFVSDIHWGFWYSDADLEHLITRINALRPDLVLFGGDYATDDDSAVQFFRRMQQMTKLHARYGIYGVVGETDRGETDFDQQRLRDAMSNAGVTLLLNQVEKVPVGSSVIYIAGADDAVNGSPDMKTLAGQVRASDFVILMAHNPSLIPDAQQTADSSGSLGWFDLGLFGHTHGGQMMFFDDLLDIASDVPARYREGWLTENRGSLLISRGVGTSVVPCRLFCYPQIHQIELTVN